MNLLPHLPTSVAVVGDHSDTFLSFHFESDNLRDADRLREDLAVWVHWFVSQHGMAALPVIQDNLDG